MKASLILSRLQSFKSFQSDTTSSSRRYDDKDITPTTSNGAPPPWHSIALVIGLIAIFTATFPSLQEIDQVATMKTFTKRVFPELLSLQAMAWIRCLFAMLVLSVSVWATFFDEGWLQASHYLKSSKLKSDVMIPMRGIRTQFAFTSWSWNLLGLSFALSSAITFMAVYERQVPPWLLRVALLSFETAAPGALLVSAVVRYAIWPQIQHSGLDTAPIKTTQMLLWHNANVIMTLVEVCLLGGLPVKLSHQSVAPLFGIVYIFFTWYMIPRWTPQHGPQFIYFFLDTTLGYMTSIVIVGLVVVLMTFYCLFGLLDNVASRAQAGGPVAHTLAVVLISSIVCRFRD